MKLFVQTYDFYESIFGEDCSSDTLIESDVINVNYIVKIVGIYSFSSYNTKEIINFYEVITEKGKILFVKVEDLRQFIVL